MAATMILVLSLSYLRDGDLGPEGLDTALACRCHKDKLL
jgi:hypothetical protein